MKKYFIYTPVALVVCFLLYVFLFVIAPTNKENNEKFFESDHSTVYKLTTLKTPAEIGDSLPQNAEERKNEKFSYRFVGNIKNFNIHAYKQKHILDIVIKHYWGNYTIYMKEFPSTSEVGPFLMGNNL